MLGISRRKFIRPTNRKTKKTHPMSRAPTNNLQPPNIFNIGIISYKEIIDNYESRQISILTQNQIAIARKFVTLTNKTLRNIKLCDASGAGARYISINFELFLVLLSRVFRQDVGITRGGSRAGTKIERFEAKLTKLTSNVEFLVNKFIKLILIVFFLIGVVLANTLVNDITRESRIVLNDLAELGATYNNVLSLLKRTQTMGKKDTMIDDNNQQLALFPSINEENISTINWLSEIFENLKANYFFVNDRENTLSKLNQILGIEIIKLGVVSTHKIMVKTIMHCATNPEYTLEQIKQGKLMPGTYQPLVLNANEYNQLTPKESLFYEERLNNYIAAQRVISDKNINQIDATKQKLEAPQSTTIIHSPWAIQGYETNGKLMDISTSQMLILDEAVDEDNNPATVWDIFGTFVAGVQNTLDDYVGTAKTALNGIGEISRDLADANRLIECYSTTYLEFTQEEVNKQYKILKRYFARRMMNIKRIQELISLILWLTGIPAGMCVQKAANASKKKLHGVYRYGTDKIFKFERSAQPLQLAIEDDQRSQLVIEPERQHSPLSIEPERRHSPLLIEEIQTPISARAAEIAKLKNSVDNIHIQKRNPMALNNILNTEAPKQRLTKSLTHKGGRKSYKKYNKIKHNKSKKYRH